jgi:hypothetical protein
MVRSVWSTVLAGLLAMGCSAGSDGGPGGESAPPGDAGIVIAQVDDFSGFCKWSSAPAITDGDGGDGVHDAGPLTVYWNKPPPHGSQQFPVGTIILKESNQADPAKRIAFAMVKRQARGTGWNSADGGGADGWEWWSVTDLGNCNIMKLWRGATPPSTESYAGMALGDCNGCHSQAADNDYVWDKALQLSNF